MVPNSLMWSAVFLVGLAFSWTTSASARSADGLARIERLLASSASESSEPSTALAVQEEDQAVSKRAILDQSCKGIYDRELFRKLEKVCEDCYNLYRKAHVGVECRSNCYGNLIFRQCLDDLLMMDVVDEYIKKVQMVGK